MLRLPSVLINFGLQSVTTSRVGNTSTLLVLSIFSQVYGLWKNFWLNWKLSVCRKSCTSACVHFDAWGEVFCEHYMEGNVFLTLKLIPHSIASNLLEFKVFIYSRLLIFCSWIQKKEKFVKIFSCGYYFEFLEFIENILLNISNWQVHAEKLKFSDSRTVGNDFVFWTFNSWSSKKSQWICLNFSHKKQTNFYYLYSSSKSKKQESN